MLPPILEIYVVWHPDDAPGAQAAGMLLSHFRGTAFSGLIGGAVDVYVRSASLSGASGDAPVPLPVWAPPPYGMALPQFTAVVVVAGSELVSSVEQPGQWRDYIAAITAATDASPDTVGLFPVEVAKHALGDNHLGGLVGGKQEIAVGAWGTEEFGETLCRDLAQGITQMVDTEHARLQVFVSHTKRTTEDERGVVVKLIDLVRDVIQGTRLREFFDASDLQPGEDWAPQLIKEAARSALLVVRTDLYSSRPWCQREVVTAKQHGMPVVVLDGLTYGEERGSFLMDHVPRIAARRKKKGAWGDAPIRRALGQLVDECLKRALWRAQQDIAGPLAADVDWWAPHAPEPATLARWLDSDVDRAAKVDERIVILHPDPPLGPDELEVLVQIARLSGLRGPVDFLTPRGLANRGV